MLRMSLIFEAKSFGIIDLFSKNSIFCLLSSNMIRLPENINQKVKPFENTINPNIPLITLAVMWEILDKEHFA